MRQVFRGVRALHPTQEKRARPLQLEQLEHVVQKLEVREKEAWTSDARSDALRYARNKALLLLGFWRGFCSDELTRLLVEHVEVISGEGMICYFPHTKSDRQYRGTKFKAPA